MNTFTEWNVVWSTFSFQHIAYDSAVLLAMAALLDTIFLHGHVRSYWQRQALICALTTGVGLLLIYGPRHEQLELSIDFGFILMGITGLFYEAVPVLVAAALLSAIELYSGDPIGPVGLLVLPTSAGIGLLWRRILLTHPTQKSASQLYLLGLVLTGASTALVFSTYDTGGASSTVTYILSFLPTFLFAPIITVVLGTILTHRIHRSNIEQRLKESERQYRMLAENVTDVLWIMNLKHREWIYISPSIERFLGYSTEEAMHAPPCKLVSCDVYKEAFITIQARTERLLRDAGAEHHYLDELEYLHKDGSSAWAEVSSRYLINENADPILFGVSRNINRRKELEGEMSAQQRILGIQTQVLDSISESVVISDLTGTLQYANPAAQSLYGFQLEDISVHAINTVIVHEDREQAHEALKHIQRGESWIGEIVTLHIDGSKFPSLIIGLPIQDENGVVTGVISISKNISERRQSEAQAFALAIERERSKLLAIFTESIAHEFRTPLSVAQSDLYIANHTNDPIKREEKLIEIKEQLTLLARLVDILTESNRVHSSSEWEVHSMDVNTAIQDAVQSLQQELSANQVDLSQHLALSLPHIMASKTHLSRAISEILRNAIQVTQPGGVISIHSEHHEEGLVIEIKDNGPGIPSDVITHIFEQYYRQDHAHTSPGLGLGLPLANAIVIAHNGRIVVDTQPNQGSCFRLILPPVVDLHRQT